VGFDVNSFIMNILITGGAGFIGTKLCNALLGRGELTDAHGHVRAIHRIRLFDMIAHDHSDARVESVIGDIANPDDVRRAVGDDTDSVFHLAAVVSGEAEANFDLGMRVNVDGTRAVLDACRALTNTPKVVFTSSLAVYGGRVPIPVPDAHAITPQNSYGAQKAIGEFLISDMSRKGFIDGRALRLPTITVRPGKPNKAASGFLSGIIREPINGVDAICPVSPDMRAWVLSPRRAIENLIIGHEAAASAFTDTRAITVPGLSVSMHDMVNALRKVAGDAAADRVKWVRDTDIERIVAGWPHAFKATFGKSLGMRGDRNFVEVVQAYVADLV
jgi:nucleoside-diphosphate-sugar epimerase